MNEAAHQLHTDYKNKPDACLECQQELKEARDAQIESQVDDLIDLRHHGEHGRHI